MKLQNIFSYTSRILRKLNPSPPVGAITVSDSVIKFLYITENKKIVSASLRLPPGIITHGILQDKNAFAQALKELRLLAGQPDTTIHIIFSLPAGVVYAQPFTLPPLPDERIDEAAALNLQMISPLDFEKVYAGYQKIGDEHKSGSGVDMLGAFVEKEKVEQFSESLEKAGFSVAAVEFPALALARLTAYDPSFSQEKGYLMVDIGADGLSLMIIRNLNLYFYHFESWKEMKQMGEGKEVQREDFLVLLRREIQKVMNFYATRWGGQISDMVLSSGPLEASLGKEIATQLHLSIRTLATPQFAVSGAGWFSALGSALRGTLARSEDTFLSLTDASAEKRYHEARMLRFITLWRKAFITTMGFILVLFIVADSFLARMNFNAEQTMQQDAGGINLTEVKTLEAKAKEFNQLVKIIAAAQPEYFNWQGVLGYIGGLSGEGITIRDIRLTGTSGTFTGTAGDVDALLSFKKKMALDTTFESVSFPITGIVNNANGSLNFTVSVTLKK